MTAAERDALHHALDAVLDSGRLVLGPYTAEFENQFATLVRRSKVVAVNSGTSALEIIFRCLNVDGREVLVPANTNFATAIAVVNAGGLPVLYDGGLFFARDDLLPRITRRTAAVVVVHIGGYLSPELPGLASDLDRLGIPLVEDAAHAHGSTLDAQPAGTFGYAAAFSFFPTKVITTFEGGVVVTADDELATTARSYRDQGKNSTGNIHVVRGNSWRMTELGAAFGLIQLADFPLAIQRRTSIVRRYANELECAFLHLPSPSRSDVISGHKAIALLADPSAQSAFRARLRQAGVELGRGVYEFPLHRQPVFAQWIKDGSFPRADRFASQHVSFPIWTSISDDEVGDVINSVRSYLTAEVIGP